MKERVKVYILILIVKHIFLLQADKNYIIREFTCKDDKIEDIKVI